MTAKNEEHGQGELAKRQRYHFRSVQPEIGQYCQSASTTSDLHDQRRCYICNGADHLVKFSKVSKSESKRKCCFRTREDHWYQENGRRSCRGQSEGQRICTYGFAVFR